MRLIEVREVLGFLCKTCLLVTEGGKCERKCFEYREIDNLPTIEAEPVKHGRWEMLPYTEMYKNKCSFCGKGSDLETNYCPNCGAKMEVDDNERQAD